MAEKVPMERWSVEAEPFDFHEFARGAISYEHDAERAEGWPAYDDGGELPDDLDDLEDI